MLYKIIHLAIELNSGQIYFWNYIEQHRILENADIGKQKWDASAYKKVDLSALNVSENYN